MNTSTNVLSDCPNVFHTLQQTSSECIFEIAQDVTLPKIDPIFLNEEGRKDKDIGNVGRAAGVGKGRRIGLDSSADDLRNGGIGEVGVGGSSGIDVGIERDIFGRPTSEIDRPINLGQAGRTVTDGKDGVFETSFSFSSFMSNAPILLSH